MLLRGQPCLEGCDDVVDESLALRMVDPKPLPHRVVHVDSNEDFWPSRDIPVGGHQQIRRQDADFFAGLEGMVIQKLLFVLV